MRFTRITIIKTRKPQTGNINEELQWLGGSLGLFSERDKDKSCFRIFITLLKDVKYERGLSSDEIAERLSLTRGTVVHHLNRLMSAGLVDSSHNRYTLSVERLESLIEELNENLKNTIDELKSVAKNVDEKLNL